MKNFMCATLIATMIISCSENVETPLKSCTVKFDLESQQFPQTWKLVKMTGSMIDSERTGTDMDWQETLLLKQDGTFTKNRQQNNQLIEASGIYSFALAGDSESIELSLTYTFESSIITSCYGLLFEKYILISNCKLIGTWSHCDGQGLEYVRQ